MLEMPVGVRRFYFSSIHNRKSQCERSGDLVSVFAPFVVLFVQRLCLGQQTFRSIVPFLFAYLWQVHVWDDDLVESTWCILPAPAWVTVWVVLIGARAASLPWL